MRFSAAVVATTLAVVARAQDTTSAPVQTTVEVPTMTYSMDPVQSSIQSCIGECDASDVNCIAKCAPVSCPVYVTPRLRIYVLTSLSGP